jgi:formamidopyrimidine-DNA glycosylase
VPELPEVETTRQGISPYCEHQQIDKVVVRDRRLRWPVSRSLEKQLEGHYIDNISRRAKYLLFHTDNGTLILHLGMSGSLRISDKSENAGKHDHVDIQLSNQRILRFNDPRRFGSLHFTRKSANQHKLIRELGPEPLSEEFIAQYLHQISRRRKAAIKNLIMNSKIVVGVGNIYASESLYMAGIHPARQAARISLARYEKLVVAIQTVLQAAIASGGSTLNDFIQPDGEPGYFQHHFRVYGKSGQPCEHCGHAISHMVIGQRSTFYCKQCQH